MNYFEAWLERERKISPDAVEAALHLNAFKYYIEYYYYHFPDFLPREIQEIYEAGLSLLNDPIGLISSNQSEIFPDQLRLFMNAKRLYSYIDNHEIHEIGGREIPFEEAFEETLECLRTWISHYNVENMTVDKERLRSYMWCVWQIGHPMWGTLGEQEDFSPIYFAFREYFWLYVERECDRRPNIQTQLRAHFIHNLDCGSLLQGEETVPNKTESSQFRRNIHVSMMTDIPARDMSILKKLGYQIDIPTEERHKRLLRSMKVSGSFDYPIQLLRFLIDTRGGSESKDYSRAIRIWQEDLQYLLEIFQSE